MKHLSFFTLSILLVPTIAYALVYDTTHLPYTDVPDDRATAIAMSTLTELEIVEGYHDGTFRPDAPINRAEFMKIVMGLIPPPTGRVNLQCFPDVPEHVWYTLPVCYAKELGIVHGNLIQGVSPDKWPFEPTRLVRYEEAVKILINLYNVPTTEIGGTWYAAYIQAVERIGAALGDGVVGSALTRGQMARLAVAFIAHHNGELAALRHAEKQAKQSSSSEISSSGSSESSEPSESSESSVSPAPSSQTQAPILDPLSSDTSTDDSFLILGGTTSILGAANLYSNAEPINIDEVIVNLVSANASIDHFLVYDDQTKLIGRAYRNTSTKYTLPLKSGHLQLPYREDFSFYVRAVMRPQDSGGISGGTIQVSSLGIEGTGAWSSRDYQQFTTETFSTTQTARAGITGITNAGPVSAPLIAATGVQVGSFRFSGVTGHSNADLFVTDLVFTVSLLNTTFSNPTLRADGSSNIHSCTLVGSTVTCSSIPAEFGSLEDRPRTLTLYGDVSVTAGSTKASVQVVISDPGTVSSAGDITWSDGDSSFTWIEGMSRPAATGTYYSY